MIYNISATNAEVLKNLHPLEGIRGKLGQGHKCLIVPLLFEEKRGI
jgi:hypothetical protein